MPPIDVDERDIRLVEAYIVALERVERLAIRHYPGARVSLDEPTARALARVFGDVRESLIVTKDPSSGEVTVQRREHDDAEA